MSTLTVESVISQLEHFTIEPDPQLVESIVAEPAQWLSHMSPADKTKVCWIASSSLKVHTACDVLPWSDQTFVAIRQSVRENGILHPLAVAADGRIIDGRYRLRAAVELGIPRLPTLKVEVDGDAAIDWVFLSKHDREHLDEGGRAMLAVEHQARLSAGYRKARAAKMTAARLGKASKTLAAVKGSNKLDSRQELCKAYKVSTRMFNSVKRVKADRPDLYEEMRSGRLDPAAAIKRKGRNTEIARVEKARLAIPAATPDTDGQLINRIHCGDAVETMRKLPDDFASLVLFSPPYFGVPIEYDPPLPKQTYAEYLTYQREVLVESFRTVRPGGRVGIVIDTVRNYDKSLKHRMLPIVHDFVRIAIECGWAYFDDLAWFKDEISGSKTNFGSLASCSAPGLARNHEHILLFFKEPFKLDGDPALSDLDRDSHLAWWTTGWHIKPEVDKELRALHVAPFPEEIPKRLITMLTFRGDVVVDPYNGSGTTTAVAARNGRRFVGIDQSEKYCVQARQRTGQAQQFVGETDEASPIT